jgi:hypothetical protein
MVAEQSDETGEDESEVQELVLERPFEVSRCAPETDPAFTNTIVLVPLWKFSQ